MSSIDIRELVKQWVDVVAVDKVSMKVSEGSLTVLLGPSGCGKSTILRLIAGLEKITAGSILIGGKDVTHMDPAARGVSMVFQSHALFPHLNVRDNIRFSDQSGGDPAVDRRAGDIRSAGIRRQLVHHIRRDVDLRGTPSGCLSSLSAPVCSVVHVRRHQVMAARISGHPLS